MSGRQEPRASAREAPYTRVGRPSVSAGSWQVPAHDTVVLRPARTRHAVIVPVWNEGERFERQLREMRPYTEIADIIVADAPSTDGSTTASKLAAANVHAVVSLAEPGRQSASLRAALAYAMNEGFEGIILMDGNGKDDPAGIEGFVRELDSGGDYVQGSRFLPRGKAINTPRSRMFLIRFVHAPLFSLLCGRRFTDSTNGFRAFSRRLLLDPRVRPFRNAFGQYEIYPYLAWAACRYNFDVRDLAVTRSYPAVGPVPTKISLFHGNWQMLKPLLMILFRRY